jgi:molecular chaperone HscB
LNNSKNFFEIFSLPVAWEVDFEQLDIKFRALQKALHPDRYATKNDFEKRLAVQTAATINQAYQTIKNPLSRAQYLLELENLDASQETHITSDGQFLMEQMLLREALSEVRGNENAKQSLVSLSIEAQQNAAKIQSDFANQYQQKAYNKAFDSLAKMQFSIKFIDDIKALEAELEDL